MLIRLEPPNEVGFVRVGLAPGDGEAYPRVVGAAKRAPERRASEARESWSPEAIPALAKATLNRPSPSKERTLPARLVKKPPGTNPRGLGQDRFARTGRFQTSLMGSFAPPRR